MRELSDEGLEGLIAHELGHIKYNHSNKKLALSLCAGLFNYEVLHRLGIGIPFATSLIVAWIINKRFEKEADAFAYEANGKAKGLIEFFELLLKKDEIREEEFVTVYELLQKNKSLLSSWDYYRLVARYYVAKGGHLYAKAYKRMYHETFVGAHPSPQARIKAAQDYLAQQNA
jgi:Zn-dependent protease with chaperone function